MWRRHLHLQVSVISDSITTTTYFHPDKLSFLYFLLNVDGAIEDDTEIHFVSSRGYSTGENVTKIILRFAIHGNFTELV